MIVGITDNNSFDVLEDCGDDDAHPKAGLYLQRGEKPLQNVSEYCIIPRLLPRMLKLNLMAETKPMLSLNDMTIIH